MAKITKSDLKAALTKIGTEFDPNATFAALEALLPDGHALKGEDEDEQDEAKEPVDAERQARWQAFLEGARSQRPDTKDHHGVSPRDVFDAQKKRGEFDEIPASFR